MIVGSTIGGCVPSPARKYPFGYHIVPSAVRGFTGIWAGYRLARQA